MGGFLIGLRAFLGTTAGKIVTLALVAALAGYLIYARGKSDGRDEVAAKTNAATLKDVGEQRRHGEQIERDVENAADRELVECLRTGRC